MKRANRLRELIQRKSATVLPGVYDCISAKLVEESGYDAAFVTGAGLAGSVLGFPDVGLITMSEVLEQTRRIVYATSLPVFADCDTGYGNPINVYRTIQEFERAGVAGLFIEDQVIPKRCGHFKGKQIIRTEEMVKKLEAAVEARCDPDLVIMARTDALAVHGVEHALERAEAYVAAGADMIFVEAPTTLEEMAMIPKSISVPTMINLVEGGVTPLATVRELEDMGYKFVTFSGSLQKSAIKAMRDVLHHLREKGSLEGVLDAIVSLEDRSALLGLPSFYEKEKKYSTRESPSSVVS